MLKALIATLSKGSTNTGSPANRRAAPPNRAVVSLDPLCYGDCVGLLMCASTDRNVARKVTVHRRGSHAASRSWAMNGKTGTEASQTVNASRSPPRYRRRR